MQVYIRQEGGWEEGENDITAPESTWGGWQMTFLHQNRQFPVSVVVLYSNRWVGDPSEMS